MVILLGDNSACVYVCYMQTCVSTLLHREAKCLGTSDRDLAENSRQNDPSFFVLNGTRVLRLVKYELSPEPLTKKPKSAPCQFHLSRLPQSSHKRDNELAGAWTSGGLPVCSLFCVKTHTHTAPAHLLVPQNQPVHQ